MINYSPEEMEDILDEMYNSFTPTPLQPGDPAYVNCSAVRGDEDVVTDLGRIVRRSHEFTYQLYSGYRGSGKTTELLRLKKALEDKGHVVVYFAADEEDLSVQDVQYTDILLACTRHLLLGLKERADPHLILDWLKKRLQDLQEVMSREIKIDEVNLQVGLQEFAKLTAAVRAEPSQRQKIREQVEPHTETLITALNAFIEDARKDLPENTKLLVIADNLDRIVPIFRDHGRSNHEEIFLDRHEQLKNLNCHIIYTVPIFMVYSDSAPVLKDYYGFPQVLPSIMVREENSEEPYLPGLEILQTIIQVRVPKPLRDSLVPDVFESEEVLQQLCLMSGGHVRDLVQLMQEAINKTETLPIEAPAVQSAVDKLRDVYRRAVQENQWEVLKKVRDSRKIFNDKMHRSLLFSRFLLEYRYSEDGGDKRIWYDVHSRAVEGVVMAKQLWEKEFITEARPFVSTEYNPVISQSPWDPETAEVLGDLLRTLRRKKGFGLFFVQCNPAQGERVIKAIGERFPQKRLVQMELNRQSETLYGELQERYQTEGVDIACITGVEQALYNYEDTKRLAGWSDEEIYNYSWKGLAPLLSHLNRLREAFEANLPIALVFLVPSFVIDYFVQRAPDFFDWRSGFFKFPVSSDDLPKASQELVDQDYQEYLDLTPEERIKKILDIKEKIIQLDSSDWEYQSNLLREQGKLFQSNEDLKQALDCYNRALKVNPENYKAWNNKAFVLNDIGRYKEAIDSYDRAIEIKPGFDYYFNRGNILGKLERYEDAISSYDRALEIKPDLYEAWNNRGVALLKLERYSEAIDSYDRALEIKPDFHYAWYNRGAALNNLKRYEEAIDSYDRAIEIKPDFHYAWYSRGYSLNNLERYEDAISSYDRAIEIKPDYHEAWYIRGAALNNLKRYEEAIDSCDRAIEIKPDFHYAWYSRGYSLNNLERYSEAISSCDRAIEIKPDFHEAWYSRGYSLNNLERYSEAISSYDRALEIKPDLYEAWDNRGVALLKLERYSEAISSYDHALEIKPDFHYAWSNRGAALGNLERHEEAISSYDHALEIKPDFHYAWNSRGKALRLLQKYEEALENFNRAIEIKPDFHKFWQQRGILLRILERYKEALQSYNRAIKIKPDFYQVWLNRGNVLRILKRYQEAIKNYNCAIKIKPDFHPAWLNRGIVLRILKQYKEAIKSYNRAIEIKPDFYEAWYAQGIALRISKQYQEALASYNRALEIKPDFYQAWFNKAILFLILKKYEESIESFNRVLEIKPDFYQVCILRGMLLNILKRYEEAIDSYDHALEIKPDFHDAWNYRGKALNNLERYEDAIDSYDRALEIKPDFHYAWYNRGVALGNLERYSEAISSYDRALEIKPDFHKAWFNRGAALGNLERHEEAISSYDRALEIKPDLYEAWDNRGVALLKLERYSEAISSCDRALEIKPDFHYAWNNRGVALLKLERYSEAIDSCDRALEIKPDYHYAWNSRGNALRNLERYSEAIDSYDHALEIKPDYHYAWSNRGAALLKLERYSEAISSYDRALEIKPDLHYAWNSRGNALRNLERYEEAISSYDRALEIKPDLYEAWNGRGIALYQLGKLQDAFDCFVKITEIEPKFEDGWNGLGYLTLAQYSYGLKPILGKPLLIRRLSNFKGSQNSSKIDLELCQKALDWFDTALNLQSKNNLIWANRSFPAYYLKQYETALQNCDLALKLDPDNQTEMNEIVHSNRGSILLKLRKPKPALHSFAKALAIHPQLGEALIGKSTALYELKRYPEAIHSLIKALILTSPSPQLTLTLLIKVPLPPLLRGDRGGIQGDLGG